MRKRVLLVEPDFPIPAKSKNHKRFLPIGLLKLASYLRSTGNEIRLIRGIPRELIDADILSFDPQEIWVTSLFTYWSRYVRDAVRCYKEIFPNAKVIVGGIYASLMPEQCKEYTGCDEVYRGVLEDAERLPPAYDLITNANPSGLDYQILHASRGCLRKCPFCGVWKIERVFDAKESIKNEIRSRKIVFYDNNFLYNPYIENILAELTEKNLDWCESQSGFDGRILLEKPHLAKLLKQARFVYPRIAWDWGYDEVESVKSQVDLLVDAGYKLKEIYVFMLYNWDIPFEVMERKRLKCWEWKVQIADCRYRPLDRTNDEYNPRVISQTSEDYYIHELCGWTDAMVKQFRKNVRRQNICARHGFPFYSKAFEQKKFSKEITRTVRLTPEVEKKTNLTSSIGVDYWFPNQTTYPSDQ